MEILIQRWRPLRWRLPVIISRRKHFKYCIPSVPLRSFRTPYTESLCCRLELGRLSHYRGPVIIRSMNCVLQFYVSIIFDYQRADNDRTIKHSLGQPTRKKRFACPRLIFGSDWPTIQSIRFLKQIILTQFTGQSGSLSYFSFQVIVTQNGWCTCRS